MTDIDPKAVEEIRDDLNEAMAQVCAKHDGEPGGAFICALAAIVAKAIDLHVIDNTPAGRAELLGGFINAVKDCLEQQHEDEDRTLQ